MKLGFLLSTNHEIVGHRAGSNPFHLIEADRLPFLLRVRPARLGPVAPALGPGPPATGRRRVRRLGAKAGGWVTRLMIGLAICTAIGCGFGAQHIAYTRQKAQLCRVLRQRELELREVAQARRVLECCVAVRAAQSVVAIAGACPEGSDSGPLLQAVHAPLSKNGQSDKGCDKGCDKGPRRFWGQAPASSAAGPSVAQAAAARLGRAQLRPIVAKAPAPMPGRRI